MTLLEQVNADLPAFLDKTTGFAVAAFIERTGGEAGSLSVIFDSPHVESNPEGVRFGTEDWRMIARDSDIVGVVRGDAAVIGASIYKVSELHPDGTGLTEIQLLKDKSGAVILTDSRGEPLLDGSGKFLTT